MPAWLLPLDLGGAVRVPWLPHVRVSSHIPILAVLALVFVIPHDPSTRMNPEHVGAVAYTLAPAAARRWTRVSRGQEAPLQPVPEPRVLARYARLLMHKAQQPQRQSLVGSLAPAPPPRPPLPTVSGCNFTTVEELREFYGPRQNWWGDFDARETRQLYHSLLPKQLLEESAALPVEDRARLAVAARRAARLYARERGPLPVTLACQLLDGVRVFAVSGNWQPDGLSEEQIFAKYATSCGGESEEEVYYKILQKSCTSNLHVDAAVGLAGAALEKGAAIGPFGL